MGKKYKAEDIMYRATEVEIMAITRSLEDKQLANPETAPDTLEELFANLVKGRVATVVKYYADIDKAAMWQAYEADPIGIRTKLGL